MLKPKHTKDNMEKLAEAVIEEWEFKLCLEVLHDYQVEFYEKNKKAFHHDWEMMEEGG
jgi:hypothetical protein